MSTVSRVISGSVAQWAQIAVTMITQVVLVPIYLTHWSVATYGIWLAILGIMSVLSMLDMGYQSYMGFEFLRLSRSDKPLLCKSLWSALFIGLLVCLFQIVLILIIIFSGTLPLMLGASGQEEASLMHQAAIALVLQGVSWLVVMSMPGLMVRALAGFGYWPRMAWWSFAYAIITAVVPVAAVVMGGDLLAASLAHTGSTMVYAIALFVELFRLLRRERIRFVKPSITLGLTNFRLSLPLLGKSLLENVRQTGVRLVLAPLTGAVGLAAFSTMRTGANVALKGLNTVLHPLMPDLMRFLHDRDQSRSDAAFATIWIVVILCLAPGIVFLQAVIEPFYLFWTKGKIAFDPFLFATLSLGVLVYAVVQPAMAVVTGNNLTKVQLFIALLAGVVFLGLMAALVPFVGILGAGIALLLAEVVSTVAYTKHARKWLTDNGLKWPREAFSLALTSVFTAALALGCMVAFPDWKWPIVVLSTVLFSWNLWRYWKIVPSVAVERAWSIIRRVPVIHNLAPRPRNG